MFLVACTLVLTALTPTVVAQSSDPPEDSAEARIVEALGHRPLTEASAGVRWYTSNSEFIRLQEHAPPDTSDGAPREGWIMAVEAVGGDASPRAEYRLLFRDGAAVGGEYIRYTEDGAVARRRRVDATGAETLSERMTYREDGTVRSVRRCAGEECLTARFAPPGEGGEESILGDALTLQIRFTAGARPEYIRIDRDGVVSEEFLTYAAGELTERRVVRGDSVVTTTYSGGLLRSEEERDSGRLVRRIENTYDSRDRLVRQVELRRNLRRETQWTYRDEDDYVMERYENEALVLREEAGGDTTVRTHFRDGDPVFRETVVDGEVTRREIFVDGAFQEDDLS